ncbi:MAG TPA: MXAN_5187 C-terminal domain-containing protein [Thermoanaerobaculia bacterium]|nr:MXAN_5187 C-terminal domain-containing protein [Thermoanaerobaculia bacterium]
MVSEALDQLARDVRQLQVDFERFFNGGLPFPPDELRGRIQVLLRNLRNTNITAAVDNFRLGDLEARFNSYNEMYNRRLRDREEGRHPHRVIAFVETPRFDARGGIVFGSEIDSDAAEALYHGLISGPGDGPKFDLDSFQGYLRRQTAAIREKTGCTEVQFRVAEEDGKLKLKARPVPARQGG